MYRIDYEVNGSRLYIDARDVLTLLVAMPTIINDVDKKSIELVEKLVSSLIATSEEIDSSYLSINEEEIKKIYDEINKKYIEVVKSLEKETKKKNAAIKQ